jgi:hypothetical protein
MHVGLSNTRRCYGLLWWSDSAWLSNERFISTRSLELSARVLGMVLGRALGRVANVIASRMPSIGRFFTKKVIKSMIIDRQRRMISGLEHNTSEIS